MIYQNMLVSLYHLTTFTFTQLPDWFLTLSWHCVRQRLQKGKVLTTLIFCLLESLIYLPISLSLLETGQRNSRFLFLLSKLEKGIQVSLSPLKTGQENSRFLFLLSRRGKGIQISPSPLECGEIVLKFLFLFSIGLFCISSMTVGLSLFYPGGWMLSGNIDWVDINGFSSRYWWEVCWGIRSEWWWRHMLVVLFSTTTNHHLWYIKTFCPYLIETQIWENVNCIW